MQQSAYRLNQALISLENGVQRMKRQMQHNPEVELLEQENMQLHEELAILREENQRLNDAVEVLTYQLDEATQPA